MIDEYVHFNDSAMNSTGGENDTRLSMVVGIKGHKTESYKYKSEITSDETALYK